MYEHSFTQLSGNKERSDELNRLQWHERVMSLCVWTHVLRDSDVFLHAKH